MPVTVFTKPHCAQCDATRREFDKLGLPYEVVDLSENPSTREQLQQAGFRDSPVVITPVSSWSGYHPDLILAYARHAARHAGAVAA